MARLAPLLGLALLLAGCLSAAPGAQEPTRPRAQLDPGPGEIAAAWMDAHLPAAPVPFDDLLNLTYALKGSPRAELLLEGHSLEGRPLVGVLLHNGEAEGKPTVMFTASQHGNEPSGADAAILLANWLAWGDDGARDLLAGVSVYILMDANPDGRVLDQRGNAEDVDINRDHMNLRTPEARAIHAAYHRVDPVVVVDLHQFGSPPVDPPATPASSAIIFEIASVQNPLAYPGIVAASHELESHVAQAVNDAFGPGSASTYPPTDSSQDSSIHRNHYGMHNSVSLLFEARRGLADYATEVKVHVVGAMEVLRQVAFDPQAKQAAKAEAEAEPPPPGTHAYLAPPQPGLENLTDLLLAHGLNATLSAEAIAAPALHYGASAELVRADFPAGTLVVPFAQPDWRTASEMFESTSTKDSFYQVGPRDAGLDVWRALAAPV